MLDAIAQAAVNQPAKPVETPPINKSQTELIASQKSVVPSLKPAISAPESISPAFLAPPNAMIPQPVAPPHISSTAPLTTPAATVNTTSTTATPALAADSTQPTPDAIAAARAQQRQFLEQRLADIVAKDKPLKEAQLRENLKAMALAAAKAGQIEKARQMAQDPMLTPDVQAELLAEISAIEADQRTRQPIVTSKPVHPKTALPLAKSNWTPTTVPGRSLPAPLSYTPPPYSYAPAQPQYVSYALNGFGQSVGGIGVVVDDSTPQFDAQNWTAYLTGNQFNHGLWSGLRFIFPLAVPAPITSVFGWRVHPITGDRRFHSGIDLGAPMGTPVLAAYTGKVALADSLNGYGLAIILSHNNDTQETLYGHLSEIFVKPGQVVAQGAVIGQVGSTGLSTGPHLHFELRQMTPDGWQAIDPGVQLQYALARLVKAMQAG